MMNTKYIVSATLFAAALLSNLTLLAQTPPPANADAPIDGGAVVLVIGAAVLGYRKMREARNKKTEVA